MKLASFKNSAVSGIKVFKPVQYLFVKGSFQNDISTVKMRVRLVSSESGRIDEIVPLLCVDVLGEISSMNEGHFHKDKGAGDFALNVMLHPTSAVYLSNDRYLEIDIQGLDPTKETTIYGIETPVVDKDFLCRYNKFYMSAGELQKTFSVGENENLVLPVSSFEEVTLHYKNGASCSYTKDELQAIMMSKNDLVCVPGNSVDGAFVCGYASMYGLDVSDVADFTIRRTVALEAFEFVLMDTVKE